MHTYSADTVSIKDKHALTANSTQSHHLFFLIQTIPAGEEAFSIYLQHLYVTGSLFYTSAKRGKLNWAGYVHSEGSQTRGRQTGGQTKQRGAHFWQRGQVANPTEKLCWSISLRFFYSDTWQTLVCRERKCCTKKKNCSSPCLTGCEFLFTYSPWSLLLLITTFLLSFLKSGV